MTLENYCRSIKDINSLIIILSRIAERLDNLFDKVGIIQRDLSGVNVLIDDKDDILVVDMEHCVIDKESAASENDRWHFFDLAEELLEICNLPNSEEMRLAIRTLTRASKEKHSRYSEANIHLERALTGVV